METISFAVKLSEEVRKRLKEFCDELVREGGL